MAAEYRIHRPYVLASLPRPLDHTDGRIVAREVYSLRDGRKKKKRMELAVGVDGETASIYDTLQSSPVRHIAAASTSASGPGDVVLICEDGQITYLSGENLALQWSAPSRSTVQDVVAQGIETFAVEYASSGGVSDFRDGIFKSRPEVFSALPRDLDSYPSMIFLIVKSVAKGQVARHALVLAAMEGLSAVTSNLQKLIPLDISPLKNDFISKDGKPVYHVDVQSGHLMELVDGRLSSYDITGAVPKRKSAIQLEDANSFTCLSRPFLLSASSSALVLYNHQYRSIHAKAGLDLSELPIDGQQARCCQLITHLRSQDLVVALIDDVLVSIHVEPPSSHGKRCKRGLLIDSIGRGTSSQFPEKKLKTSSGSAEFSRLLPGTMTDAYMAKYQADVKRADDLLSKNDLRKWETFLRRKFGLGIRKEAATTMEEKGTEEAVQEPPEWEWAKQPGSYPVADRRWVLYAIGRAFAVEASASEDSKSELRLIMPDSNVATYLVVAGHLTISNLTSVFRDELTGRDVSDTPALARNLIDGLTDADPSMTLLLNYLQATKLGEVELLLAIRSLMSSMDLLPDTNKLNKMKLLADDAHDQKEIDSQEMDLDDLERDIALTEHYLGDDSSIRSRGLTLAFAKLWRVPAIATVKALRATIRTDELLAFIYLLRVELVRGSWTSLYIDQTGLESEDDDPPPDGVITLIADLLGRCVDAMGAGGWLLNDAMSWADGAEASDFLTALKLEVAAALEGIEEAVYLSGIVGEAARFGLTVEKNSAARQPWHPNKANTLRVESRESRLLPLGLKAKLMPTRQKVVSGGEVVRRNARETGHLISQKVEVYSLERLAV
ncbi:hypothetical protein UVI_02003250 [Ustilaginoidea virens]|uniref:Uncharacterized protein n=1 Tax=Ustilaginoidea virens TaxID=1159556 RepID=A0A1B5L202_USTVR|nr:hypothetical protein UVI_02003250 [Ustilaginoidea virens]